MARRATGVAVDAVYSTTHSKNSWAMLSGGTSVPGFSGTFDGSGEWIRLDGQSTDGVTNTFNVLIAAHTTNSGVEVATSGTTGSSGERILRAWKPGG